MSNDSNDLNWITVDLSPHISSADKLSGVGMLELMLRAKIWCDNHIKEDNVVWQGNLVWIFRYQEDATLFKLTWE